MAILKTLALLVVLGVLLALGFVFSGVYNIGADDPHTPMVYKMLETMRDRSILARSDDLEVPNLDDPALLRSGAGNYHAMCTGCHLMPGMADTEISRGLYPRPPNLTKRPPGAPARDFWIIKHGIKATGMPAWGESMSDEYIWGMVAFVQKLPTLGADQYEAAVAASGGHQHGGGETRPHTSAADADHDDTGTAPHGHGEEAEAPAPHDDTGSPPHEHPEEKQAPAHDDTGTAPHSHDEPTDEHAGMDMDAEPPEGEAEGHSHAPGTPAHDDRARVAKAAPAGPVGVVAAFEKALQANDFAAAERNLDPDVVTYESGGIERSRDEYAAGHMKSDSAFLKRADIELLTQTGDEVGDLAWVASERRITTVVNQEPVDIVSTETMVLRRATGAWRIAHIHWSSRPTGSGH